MDIFDLLIPPIYAIGVLFLAHKFSIKQKLKNKAYKYFMPGLMLKMFGAIVLGLVYFYYYKGGDTLNYFDTACALIDELYQRPDNFVYLYFGSPALTERYLINPNGLYECTYWVNDAAAYFAARCFVPVVLLCGKSYMASAIVVAALCYLGVWRLFLIFTREFPNLERQFAWSILYVPSVIFWGGGIMKDSITLSAACFYVHGFYWFFAQKQRRYNYILSLIVASYLLLFIKPYVLFALLPGSILWFFSLRISKVKSAFIRVMFAPALLAAGLFVSIFVLRQMGSSLGKYSIDNVIETASRGQRDLKQSYYGGNAFDIGDYEPTISGVMSVAHKAIFATLFRPTFLDVRNVVMGICSIENMFVFGFTIYLLVKLKVYKFFSLIPTQPLLMFSFIFSIFFAFSVGISISNFGALVRLKIPCIPFFLSSLVILNELYQRSLKVKVES